MDSAGEENVVRSGMASVVVGVVVSAHAVCVGTVVMTRAMLSMSVAEAMCCARVVLASVVPASVCLVLRNFLPLKFVDKRYYFGNGFVESFRYFVPYFGCIEECSSE